jgi:translation initiation factor 2 subunit 1
MSEEEKKDDSYPEVGELVICNVKRVKDYGAFVELEDYSNKEGFIHIAEVSTGWVKYIRDYVREGQKIVCKVIKIDVSNRHIDLSLKQISPHQRREKITEWKNSKKAVKWMEIVAQESKLSEKDKEELVSKLSEVYGNLYNAFEMLITNFEKVSEIVKNKTVLESMKNIAEKNISIAKIKISETISLQFFTDDGVLRIKNLFSEIVPLATDADIRYIGGGKYRISLKSDDYKETENVLKKINTKLTSLMKHQNAIMSIARD